MKRNPLIRMREMYDSLSNSEKTVAKYILEDPSLVMQYNIRELAARLYVSPATVVRLSQTLGFKGYREFKQAMVYGLAQYENNGKEHLSDIGRQDTIQEIAEKITYQNTKSLEETLSFLDVEVIQEMRGAFVPVPPGTPLWHGRLSLCCQRRQPKIPSCE